MVGRRWLQPPRHLLTSFLVVVVACVGALAWLGYRLLEQDRALESQRLQEQLESAADLTTAAMEHKLAELDSALDAPPSGARLPDGAILFVAGPDSFELHGSRRLLFYPESAAPQDSAADARLAAAATEALRTAELLEFQRNDPQAAAALYRNAARTDDPAVRAAALVRLGRSLRKAGRTDEALDACTELTALGSMLVPGSGLPAELLARDGHRHHGRRGRTALPLRALARGPAWPAGRNPPHPHRSAGSDHPWHTAVQCRACGGENNRGHRDAVDASRGGGRRPGGRDDGRLGRSRPTPASLLGPLHPRAAACGHQLLHRPGHDARAGGGAPRATAARALLHLGQCHEKLGNAEARSAYERPVRDFADQPEEMTMARARLAAMGGRDTSMRVRQVWAGLAPEGLFGSITRDGGFFYNVRSGLSEVYVGELDVASGRMAVAPVPATDRYAGSNSTPDWSADGRELVFLSQRGPGPWGKRAICVKNPASGEVREIASKLDRVITVRWYPDGRRLAFTSGWDRSEVWVMENFLPPAR